MTVTNQNSQQVSCNLTYQDHFRTMKITRRFEKQSNRNNGGEMRFLNKIKTRGYNFLIGDKMKENKIKTGVK